MDKLKLVLLSGLLGAGKTTALLSFEEQGYQTIMDLPGELLPSLLLLILNHPQVYQKTAVSVPIVDLKKAVDAVRSDSRFELLSVGLTAGRDELRKRYRLTRHTHPLESKGLSKEECLDRDQAAFEKCRPSFDYVIDTSFLSNVELKERLASLVGEKGLTILFESFGFQYGLPLDADVVLDARMVRNPYWVESLRPLSGLDEPVRSYIEEDPLTEEFMKMALEAAHLSYASALHDGRHLVVFAVGCSGGQHRSVYFASRLHDEFKEGKSLIFHREEKRHGHYGR